MSNYFSRLLISTDLEFGTGEKGLTITMDGRIRESFTISLSATEHPVDYNTSITDHMIVNPRTYILEGVVTDTPLGIGSAFENIIDSVNNISEGGQGLAGSLFNVFEDNVKENLKPSVQAFQTLLAIAQARGVFSITTSLGQWDSMAIIDINVEIDKNKSNILYFTAVCREIRRVKITHTDSNIGSLVDDVKASGEDVLDKGRQSVTESKSVLTSIFDF